jgi:hypothetical protein
MKSLYLHETSSTDTHTEWKITDLNLGISISIVHTNLSSELYIQTRSSFNWVNNIYYPNFIISFTNLEL